MGKKVINIERDFSRYPAGRYLADGPYNGERFRKEFLVPALSDNADKLVIELDGARGLGSSFLDEAFGGLVRSGYTAKEVLSRIELKSEDASLIKEIEGYIEQAKVGGQR